MRAKGNLAGVLRAELGKPAYVVSLIIIGSKADYQPIEKRWQLNHVAPAP